MIRWLVSLLLLLIQIALIRSQLSAGDSAVLSEFYAELTNTRALNWNVSADFCGQRGILCNDARVVSIQLSNTLIAGTIPTSFGNLDSLQILSLDGNYLEGTIPSEIGNLMNLQELNLKGNLIYGTIPSSLGNLSQLTLLDLSNNELTGSIPTLHSSSLFLAGNSLCPIANYSTWGSTTDYVTTETAGCTPCGMAYVCRNGGTCTSTPNQNAGTLFTCQCPSAYQGVNCESLFDYCQIQPCLNQGNCTLVLGGYTCACQDGFTGDDCQTDLSMAPLIPELSQNSAGIMLLVCCAVFIAIAMVLKRILLPGHPAGNPPYDVSLEFQPPPKPTKQLFEWR